MAQQLAFTSVIEGAAKLPLVRIDRTQFLTKNLKKLCTPAQLQKAITEGTLHADIPIVRKIATMLGQRMTKDIFAKSVGKAIPILGGAISGGLTLATFKPMSHKLQKYLSEMAHMSPAEFAEYEAANTIVIDEKDSVIDAEQVEVVIDETLTNGWMCSCSAVNKGKFCPDCGKAKPAGLPQYKCDKCGWEPEDKTYPPNFCPECGDPFDDGDIT